MVKIVDPKVEIRTLKTLCTEKSEFSSKLFSLVDESMFGYAPALNGYKRLQVLFNKNGRVPSWNTLLNEPSLKDAHKNILNADRSKPCSSEGEMFDMFSVLESFRKMRKVAETLDKFNASITEEGTDMLTHFEKMREQLNSIESKTTEEDVFTVGENAGKVINNIFDGEQTPVIPTGIKEFDERNGGIPYTGLLLIGAPTGTGKTDMAVNLAKNMALNGHSSVVVSLEMSEEQVYARLLSLLTGIERTKITMKDLSDADRSKLKQEYKAFSKKLKKLDSSFSVFVPRNDVSMEETLMRLKPFNYDIIFIDYISLLKGLDDDAQWRKLGEVTRFAKRFASSNNCVVAVLVQLDDNGKIRYSKTMTEHASNAWFMSMQTEEGSTDGILTIEQPKARNQQRFRFQLHSDFLTGRIRSLKSGEGFKVPEQKHSKRNPDITVGDIEDDDI